MLKFGTLRRGKSVSQIITNKLYRKTHSLHGGEACSQALWQILWKIMRLQRCRYTNTKWNKLASDLETWALLITRIVTYYMGLSLFSWVLIFLKHYYLIWIKKSQPFLFYLNQKISAIFILSESKSLSHFHLIWIKKSQTFACYLNQLKDKTKVNYLEILTACLPCFTF